MTQGEFLSTVLYGLILSMLVEHIWGEYPGFLQSWYSGDFITVGADAHFKPVIVRIESLGPARGLFIKPDKSQFVRAPGVSEEAAWAATSPLE